MASQAYGIVPACSANAGLLQILHAAAQNVGYQGATCHVQHPGAEFFAQWLRRLSLG